MPTINKPKRTPPKRGNHYDSDRRKIYNSERWQRLRAWKFTNDPLCELCIKEQRATPTEDIHHITSFMSTEDPIQRVFLAYDYDNLMSLCKPCHQRMHNGTP